MDDNGHLTTDEITVAVIDRSDLPEPRREHLSMCRFCRAELAAVTDRLAAMGEEARQMVPLPPALPGLPALPAPPSLSRPWFRRRILHGLGLAVVILLALTFYLEVPERFFPLTPPPDRFSSREDGGQLMAEVALLVENALPQEYIDLAGVAEPPVEEGFLEFLVPLPQTDSTSTMLRFKGAVT